MFTDKGGNQTRRGIVYDLLRAIDRADTETTNRRLDDLALSFNMALPKRKVILGDQKALEKRSGSAKVSGGSKSIERSGTG